MSHKKKIVFKGCATALITPFIGDGVDFESLERLIEFQIKEGANAIVVCGTTGESATLSDKERQDIIEFSVRKANKRIPVIAGTGCNNIEKAAYLSAFASNCGAFHLKVTFLSPGQEAKVFLASLLRCFGFPRF